ncbi:MAG: transposase, partial [Pyrinomonadaceae bacterium]
SDGTQIDNFKYFESSQKQLRRVQRKVARRRRGSHRRRKAVALLQKVHAKIRNQRSDFHHQVSRLLVNSYDLIAIEDLNIKGLSKGILAKQVNDVAWGSFFSKLEYKAENAGRQLIKVNPNGTSQTCTCGETVKKNLSVRWHECLKCGVSNHRDIISSQVILSRGLRDVSLIKAARLRIDTEAALL